MRMKEAYFLQHVALYRSVCLKHLLKQFYIAGHFVMAQKVVYNQSELLPTVSIQFLLGLHQNSCQS
jgi:hypothetical protein